MYSAAPIPAKGAHLPATSATKTATMGARKGSNHNRGKEGSLCVPSHHVGLPMLRLVTAAEASAAVTRSHDKEMTSGHGFSSDLPRHVDR